MKKLSPRNRNISIFTGIFIIFLAMMFSYNIYYPHYVSEKIIGTWRSETEGLYTVTFDSYGVVTESFKNEVLSRGEWEINRSTSTEFELITTMDTEFRYIIKGINKNTLTLLDIVSNQEYVFDKID